MTDDNSISNNDNMEGILPNHDIESMILNIRGTQVILDRSLAVLYGVETKVLNQAVKRNIKRFPPNFMFQLTQEECSRSQFVTLKTKRGKNLKYLPYAFTENGVAMLSAILRSDTAISVSIRIMEAFTAMRRFLFNNANVFQRLETIEYHQLKIQEHIDKHDEELEVVFDKLQEKSTLPLQQGIFYDGQVFDAYTFVAGLVKSATREIILIDNYVDETVLTLLDKRAPNVCATIYTAQINRQLQLDLTRHNAQFAPITINLYRMSHDRFLCIDDEVYHIGASIKDLGKKWFAFAKMYALKPIDLVNRINSFV